jgi:hypothetical protein
LPDQVSGKGERGPRSAFQGNNFKRALQGTGGADKLAVGAPAAILDLYYGNNIIAEREGPAFAYRNTKAAPVAPGLVKYGHYGQKALFLRRIRILFNVF